MNLRNKGQKLFSVCGNTQYLYVFIISLFVFRFCVGFSVINPNNTNWLLGGDAASNYLGWEFFRDTPMSIFPLGKSPNFGTGFSSSIVFTDSIPLLAIPFKFILQAYHADFQYFGAWLLCCFILQGFFAYKLISRVSNNAVLRISGSLLFLLAPIFLYRLTFDGYGHLALVSQFMIIAAIDTAVSANFKNYKWFILMPAAILISFYIFGMILAIFISSIVFQLVSMKRSMKNHLKLLLSSSGACLVSIFVFYIAGGFSINGATDSSYGKYKASLTSLVDQQAGSGTRWSRLLGDIADLPGSSEGFSFLGIATILMVPFVVIGLVVIIRRNRQILWIFISTFAMGLFALSPSISIANRELFKYRIPNTVEPVFSAFRSSGRFMWPAIYVLMLLGILGIEHLRLRFIPILLLLPVLSIFQIWDSTNAISITQQRFSNSDFTTVLTDPNWDFLARGYSHLEVIPPLNNDPNWIDFALLAKKWSMSSNAAYVGRTNDDLFYQLSQELQAQIQRYEFAKDTLYVLTNYPPNPISAELIELDKSDTVGGARVLLIDSFVVIAP